MGIFARKMTFWNYILYSFNIVLKNHFLTKIPYNKFNLLLTILLYIKYNQLNFFTINTLNNLQNGVSKNIYKIILL